MMTASRAATPTYMTVKETLRSVILLGVCPVVHNGWQDQAAVGVSDLILLLQLRRARHLDLLPSVQSIYLVFQVLIFELQEVDLSL